jgi:hypothetical protein
MKKLGVGLGLVAFGAMVACGGEIVSVPGGSSGDASVGTDAGVAKDAQPSPPGACGPGATLCGQVCVSLSTDPTQCGRCGHDCGAGKCNAGVCQPVLINAKATSVVALATDATPDNPLSATKHIFWSGQNGVFQDDVNGGNVIMLSKAPALQSDVQVVGNKVYWLAHPLGLGTVTVIEGTVGSAMTERSVGSFSSPNGPNALTLDATGTNVFASFSETNGTYGLYRCPVSGAGCTKAVSLPPPAKYKGGLASWGLATDGTSVFFAEQNSGTLQAMTIAGSMVDTIASGQPMPWSPRVDGKFLYWSNFGSKTIWRAPIGGGAPSAVVGTITSAQGLAADSVNVYWTDGEALSYAPIAGGPTVVYVPKAGNWGPSRLVRDTKSLFFWILNGSIYRIALP